MRIVFIGCVDFSYHCLSELLKQGENVVGIFSKKASPYNADFKNLWPLAAEKKIPIFNVKDINDVKSEKIIRALDPDVIFCFGWSQIIKPNILSIPTYCSVASHPSLLPKNRGNHPIIWSLVLGMKESGLTFFKMSERIDGGDIISQQKFKIATTDSATDVYKKVEKSASVQLRKFLPLLRSGRIKSKKQKLGKGNYWRKRDMSDGKIDWRMTSGAIYNLVRALTHPYLGAHCFYRNSEIKIWKVREVRNLNGHVEPGKVLQVKGNDILIKTYDGAINILEHDFKVFPKKGEYLT